MLHYTPCCLINVRICNIIQFMTYEQITVPVYGHQLCSLKLKSVSKKLRLTKFLLYIDATFLIDNLKN